MDGLAAAEALLTANPSIQIVVHTGEPSSERLARAAALGIQINDKGDPAGLVKRLEAAAAKAANTPSAQHRLQTAVLAALLASAPGQGLVVATPAGEIPFYNHHATEFLHSPFPPQPTLLATARESLPTFDMTGKRLYPQERPISRALATGQPVPEQEMVVLRDRQLVPIVAGATPLFDDNGDFIGVATYFRTTDRGLSGYTAQIDYLGRRRTSSPPSRRLADRREARRRRAVRAGDDLRRFRILAVGRPSSNATSRSSCSATRNSGTRGGRPRACTLA
jgi:hypothetical protein